MKVSMPHATAQLSISLSRKGKLSALLFSRSESALIFFSDVPIGVLHGGVIYAMPLPGPQVRALHDWAGERPVARVSAPMLDFQIGQLLSSVGLNLIAAAREL